MHYVICRELHYSRKYCKNYTHLEFYIFRSGNDVHVTFKFKRQINAGERESIYIYNVLFHKIMRTLKFAQSSKKGNFFDPKLAKDIPVSNKISWFYS